MALRHYTLDFKLSAAADSASTVPDLLSIFHEQEMTETVHETNGHGYLGTFVGKNGRLAVVHVHSHGLVTIDLQCYEEDNTEQADNLLSALETKLKIILNSNITRIKRLPALVRGAEVDRYWPTIDDRLMEYDFDQLVYEEDSAYQNIKIFHSQQFGNALMLKDDTSTSESDLAYAQAIMGNGRENFAGKEVLILGGGDGGTLNEVVKQKPKMVTMLDIDQRVIDASRKYMRGTCGDILDNLKGDCYQTVVEDCVPVLKKYVQEGKMFDYVLNELTEVPTSRKEKESKWDFLRLTLDLSIKVLHPSGKYITAVDAANRTKQLGLYEEELGKLSCPLGFSKEVACVPSFLELLSVINRNESQGVNWKWVFYTVWKI